MKNYVKAIMGFVGLCVCLVLYGVVLGLLTVLVALPAVLVWKWAFSLAGF